MKFKISMLAMLLISFTLLSACGKDTPTTPKELTEKYLSYIKENELKEANQLVGVEFNEKEYSKMDSDKKKAMNLVHKNIKFEVKDEKIDGKNAQVTVEVESVNYLTLFDQAVFENLSKNDKQSKIFDVFKKNMESAKHVKKKVDINFIKDSKKWKFDGSNSRLQAALLGYLE